MDKCNHAKRKCQKDIRGAIFMSLFLTMSMLTTGLSIYSNYKMNDSINALNAYMEKQLEVDKRIIKNMSSITKSLAEQNIRISKNTDTIMDIKGFPDSDRTVLKDRKRLH